MKKHNIIPDEGYVPDEQTAITIAIAIWTPIYGKERVEEKAPYKAVLENEIWRVFGTLPKNRLGGTPEIEINKITAEVIRVSHGR